MKLEVKRENDDKILLALDGKTEEQRNTLSGRRKIIKLIHIAVYNEKRLEITIVLKDNCTVAIYINQKYEEVEGIFKNQQLEKANNSQIIKGGNDIYDFEVDFDIVYLFFKNGEVSKLNLKALK